MLARSRYVAGSPVGALSAEQNRLTQSQAILQQLVHDIKLPGCVITYRHVAALLWLSRSRLAIDFIGSKPSCA